MKPVRLTFTLGQTVQHPEAGRFENMKPEISMEVSLEEGDNVTSVKEWMETGVKLMLQESVESCRLSMMNDAMKAKEPASFYQPPVSQAPAPQQYQQPSAPPVAPHTPPQPSFPTTGQGYAPQGNQPVQPPQQPQYSTAPAAPTLFPSHPGEYVVG